MTRRLSIWAGLGVLVAVLWAVYAASIFPRSILSVPGMSMIAQITCPIYSASLHFHFAVKFYWAVLANAATYAILGMFAETLRRQLRHA